nr:hypothetical protein [Tanacetum cinerariifolium]
MTRSSIKELITHFEKPERVFRSNRRIFKTPGLVESSSPEFDLFSNIKEHSKEEKTTKIMTETMEQYMSKTCGNYGPGVARPKINDKTHFEFKGRFLKEFRENTFSGSKHEDTNEHIRKLLKIVDLFHIPEEVILFYNGLNVPTRHILDLKGVIPTKTVCCRIRSGPYVISNTQYSSLSSETGSFPNRLHGYYYDNWKEVREVKILKTYDHTMPQKEKDPMSFTLPCFIHNICFDKALVNLGASVSVISLSTYSNLGLGDLAHNRLTIQLADRTFKHPRGIAENMLVRIGKFIFPIDFVILDIPEDDDVPLILGRPFLSTAHAKIDVFKRKITLRVGEEKLVSKVSNQLLA